MIKFCTECYTPSTRPRITFNSEGVCNACQWAKEKKTIDWDKRQRRFGEICDTFRGNGSQPDCIVPWSGGKDSIYVAYKMLDFGMKPLLMTVLPHLETEIGKWNRQHMCPSPKFEHLEIALNEDKYRSLAKKYFIEQGRPKHPWETAISAAVINQAHKMNIPFVIYGEEGEQEYGGDTGEKDKWSQPVTKDYLMQYYWQDNLDWEIPPEGEFEKMFFTQWSRFENWSPTKHGNEAVARGMRTEPVRSIGTFTQINQLSDKLQNLHAYLMFVKFGFGRCTSDVAIGIRDGWIDKAEGLEWIETYDGELPNLDYGDYLDYFDMSDKEYIDTICKFGNKEIMENVGAVWYLKEWVANIRRKDSVQAMMNPKRYAPERKEV